MYGVLYSLVYKLFHNIGYLLFAGIGVVLTFDHISWPVPVLIPGPGIGSKAEVWLVWGRVFLVWKLVWNQYKADRYSTTTRPYQALYCLGSYQPGRVHISVVQFLISKGTFGPSSNFVLFSWNQWQFQLNSEPLVWRHIKPHLYNLVLMNLPTLVKFTISDKCT
jgi:hypothetical protein